MIDLLSIPVGCFVVGTWLGVWGYRRQALYWSVSRTPTSEVADVEEPGLVELTGTVEPIDDETITGALSYERCLATGWRVQEWHDGSNTNSWAQVAEGYDSVPFELDDGSGEIRVELGADATASGFEDAMGFGDLERSVGIGTTTVDFERMPVTLKVAPDDRTPVVVEDFVQRQSVVAEQTGSITNVVNLGPKDGARKYREGVIQSGDEVYLLGTAERRRVPGDGAESAELVVRPTRDEQFVLSTRDESALRSDTWYGVAPLLAGVALWMLGLVSLWVLFV